MPASKQERLTPPKFKMPVAATRIYDRIPEWKFHTDLGKAKNAIAFGSGYDRIARKELARAGEIWTLIDGVWELQYVIEENTYTDDLSWRQKK